MPDFPQIDKAVRVDIFIQQGSTFMRSLTFDDFNISEFSFRGKIKKTHNDRRTLSQFTITPTSNNEIEIYLSSQESSKLIPGSIVYDIEMFYQENDVDVFVARILEGKCKVSPEVTK